MDTEPSARVSRPNKVRSNRKDAPGAVDNLVRSAIGVLDVISPLRAVTLTDGRFVIVVAEQVSGELTLASGLIALDVVDHGNHVPDVVVSFDYALVADHLLAESSRKGIVGELDALPVRQDNRLQQVPAIPLESRDLRLPAGSEIAALLDQIAACIVSV